MHGIGTQNAIIINNLPSLVKLLKCNKKGAPRGSSSLLVHLLRIAAAFQHYYTAFTVEYNNNNTMPCYAHVYDDQKECKILNVFLMIVLLSVLKLFYIVVVIVSIDTGLSHLSARSSSSSRRTFFVIVWTMSDDGSKIHRVIVCVHCTAHVEWLDSKINIVHVRRGSRAPSNYIHTYIRSYINTQCLCIHRINWLFMMKIKHEILIGNNILCVMLLCGENDFFFFLSYIWSFSENMKKHRCVGRAHEN